PACFVSGFWSSCFFSTVATPAAFREAAGCSSSAIAIPARSSAANTAHSAAKQILPSIPLQSSIVRLEVLDLIPVLLGRLPALLEGTVPFEIFREEVEIFPPRKICAGKDCWFLRD